MSIESIALAVMCFHPIGEVVEARIFRTRRGTLSGYFDHPYKLAQAVHEWDGVASVYFTLNAIRPDVLARARNRLEPYARIATRSEDILRRRWILLDVDPQRPSGIPSTDEELAAALELRDRIIDDLARTAAFPPPIRAVSGNGGHAAWPIDLPNTEETTTLIRQVHWALHAQYSNARIRVDQTVYQAAQLTKLYGTVAVKGDPSADRPRRRAQIQSLPPFQFDVRTLTFHSSVVTVDQLRSLAGQADESSIRYSLPSSSPPTHPTTPNLVELFKAHGLYLRPLQ